MPTLRSLFRRDKHHKHPTEIEIDGQKFINHGLVAFGLIPVATKDTFGDTLGGAGSAIAFERGTFRQDGDGTYSGTLVVQPDHRGPNYDKKLNWQGPHHFIDLTLSPYYGEDALSFEEAQKTLNLKYREAKLFPDALRPGPLPGSEPKPLDAEGMVLNADGGFWISDEGGPILRRFSASGTILQTIIPPKAVIPGPGHGTTKNQGFEGLTASPNGDRLYVILQSALAQDGGGDKTTNRHSRLFAWDIPESLEREPTLSGEWVIPLPQSRKEVTYAPSELHYLNDHQFLLLARDGNGHGDKDLKSDYKSADIVDISKATDIHGTKYDEDTPVAPDGKLDSSITPGTCHEFVSLVDKKELEKYGLHNGEPADATLLNAKWESLALAPVFDSEHPDDYFLFTVSDNDFTAKDGMSNGKPFSEKWDVDTQAFVFRVTLPTVARGSVEKAIGLN